jgi:hypothetical protein
VYGLYGAFLPVMIYSLFGSSRQLGVGPVAVTSLLIGSGAPPRGMGALRQPARARCTPPRLVASPRASPRA